MNIEKKISRYRKDGFPNVWISDLGDGTYRNPVLHTDYSDPDIIRVGNDFFMTASSFNNIPGLPILHSTDLVNWKLINYAIKKAIPFHGYELPQYGKAVWAPALRYNNGYFYIYVGFPDEGIVMTRTKDIFSDWEDIKLLKGCKGWIDTCPFWDDDGQAYIINAFAKSRIGFKSVLAISKMNADGTEILDNTFRIIYDGNLNNPTIEGPKLYKHNGYYYVSAPAGGVSTGWQLILRSENIYGPYEEKIVLHQGNTEINGPHQGGWVDDVNGDYWFMHFQDKEAYGRILHLQPLSWVDDWPLMGDYHNDNHVGEPVLMHKKPSSKIPNEVFSPEVSDDFVGKAGLQWQWSSNENKSFYSFERESHLRLYSPLYSSGKRIWEMSNILTLKFPAPEFTATAKMEFKPNSMGARAGIVVLGNDYHSINISRGINGSFVNLTEGKFKEDFGAEAVSHAEKVESGIFYLRVKVGKGGICKYSFSFDGDSFKEIGEDYQATTNTWVGAKIGLFCSGADDKDFADFDWVLIEE